MNQEGGEVHRGVLQRDRTYEYELSGVLRPIKSSKKVDAGAAVAIILRPSSRGLEVLLVKRAADPSDPWSGDMALPGGRLHSNDEDLMETVVRETIEETGIDLRNGRFLGTLDVAFSSLASGLGILPFVALYDQEVYVKLNEELSAFYWVPLEVMKQSKGKYYFRQSEVQAFLVEGEVVWGLTYRIINNLLQLLEDPSEGEAS